MSEKLKPSKYHIIVVTPAGCFVEKDVDEKGLKRWFNRFVKWGLLKFKVELVREGYGK